MRTNFIVIAAIAIAATTNTANAGEENTINQTHSIATANQNFYLHPAHGFPGQTPGFQIKLVMNQQNAIARENQKFYLHPAHGFPGQAPDFQNQMMMAKSNPVSEPPRKASHSAVAKPTTGDSIAVSRRPGRDTNS